MGAGASAAGPAGRPAAVQSAWGPWRGQAWAARLARGGRAAVQAAAALLHPRGTLEGGGHGSKAAMGLGAGLRTRVAARGDATKVQDSRNEGALWSPMEFAVDEI